MLFRALAEDIGHGVVFGVSDPEDVFEFDGDLAGDVGTAVQFISWQPGGGIAVALGLVGIALDGEEIERVIGQRIAVSR